MTDLYPAHPTIQAIYADYDTRLAAARRVTPGGKFGAEDMRRLLQRVASNAGCKPSDVTHWLEQRG